MSALIAPSILSADFGKLAEDVRIVDEAGADWIHVDVMDGRFVPNLTLGPPIVKAVKRAAGTDAPLDVHLMIVEPTQYVQAFRDAGADWITVHAEADPHLHRAIQHIKSTGAKAGVALNPHTPPDVLDYVLEDLDLVLAMTVNPGFGGQSLIDGVLRKVEVLAERIAALGTDTLIEVDGGVKLDNIRSIAEAGADTFVSGSAIFGTSDYGKTIDAMRRELSAVVCGD